MSKEQKIARIYEEIADKTLSFGCKIIAIGDTREYLHLFDGDEGVIVSKKGTFHNQFDARYFGRYGSPNLLNSTLETNKIIGHPVMIGDVLDWSIKNRLEKETPRRISNKIHMMRDHKRKPIEEQDDECIDFIYLLIQG